MNEPIGERIRMLLRRHDKTAKALAECLNQSEATIYHILNQRVQLDLDRAIKIAAFFNITVDELIGDNTLIRGSNDERIRELAREEAIKLIEAKLKERGEE